MASRAKRQIDPRRSKRCLCFLTKNEKKVYEDEHNDYQDADNDFENNFRLLQAFSRAFQC